jgi:hypothetical protein
LISLVGFGVIQFLSIPNEPADADTGFWIFQVKDVLE